MLHTEPVGRYVVAVCTNIACMLRGAYEVLEHVEEQLGIGAGRTTADGMFTIEDAECLAGCDARRASRSTAGSSAPSTTEASTLAEDVGPDSRRESVRLDSADGGREPRRAQVPRSSGRVGLAGTRDAPSEDGR